MEKIEKEKIINKYPKENKKESLRWFELKKRIRTVDFHRIEQNLSQEALNPFELEVKKKLASSSSPYDELARQEEEEEQASKERSLKIKMGIIAGKAKLTPQQRACYELLYLKKLHEKNVCKRLRISQVRLSQLKRQIETAFRKAHQRQNALSVLCKRGGLYTLTKRQREVVWLHEKEGLSFAQIARHLGLSKQTVYEIFQGGVKKISKGKTP